MDDSSSDDDKSSRRSTSPGPNNAFSRQILPFGLVGTLADLFLPFITILTILCTLFGPFLAPSVWCAFLVKFYVFFIAINLGYSLKWWIIAKNIEFRVKQPLDPKKWLQEIHEPNSYFPHISIIKPSELKLNASIVSTESPGNLSHHPDDPVMDHKDQPPRNVSEPLLPEMIPVNDENPSFPPILAAHERKKSQVTFNVVEKEPSSQSLGVNGLQSHKRTVSFGTKVIEQMSSKSPFFLDNKDSSIKITDDVTPHTPILPISPLTDSTSSSAPTELTETSQDSLPQKIRLRWYDGTLHIDPVPLLPPPVIPLVHMIVIPNYNEPIHLLRNTLSNLASHALAKTHYHVVLAMEEGEKPSSRDVKAATLLYEFTNQFRGMEITLHPIGLSTESRGKGSNVNWSVRVAGAKYLYPTIKSQFKGYKVAEKHRRRVPSVGEKVDWENMTNPDLIQPDKIVVTIQDVDSHVPEVYFDRLNDLILEPNSPVGWWDMTPIPRQIHNTIFQPPTFFGRNHLDVPGLVRINDFAASCMQNMNLAEGLLGLLFGKFWKLGKNKDSLWGHLPFTKSWRGGWSHGGQRFSVSNYSLTLLCAHRAGYWDTGFRAIGEDFHMTLKSGLKSGVVGCPVDICINSVHVQGEEMIGSGWKYWKSWFNNVHARYIQAVRHFYANADVGYAIRNALLPQLWPWSGIDGVSEDGIGPALTVEQWLGRLWWVLKTMETHVLPIMSGWIMTFALPVFYVRHRMELKGWNFVDFDHGELSLIEFLSPMFLVMQLFNLWIYESHHKRMEEYFNRPEQLRRRLPMGYLDYVFLPVAVVIFVTIPSTIAIWRNWKSGYGEREYVVAEKVVKESITSRMPKKARRVSEAIF